MEFVPPLLRLGWGGNGVWNSFSLLLGRDFFFKDIKMFFVV